ncbi:unnamed protein product [Ixodes hexagonus]
MEFSEVTRLSNALGLDHSSLREWLRCHLAYARHEFELELEQWDWLWLRRDGEGDGDSLEIQRCKRETAAQLARLQAESQSMDDMIGRLEAMVVAPEDVSSAPAEHRKAEGTDEGEALAAIPRTLSADADNSARVESRQGAVLTPYKGLGCTPKTADSSQKLCAVNSTSESVKEYAPNNAAGSRLSKFDKRGSKESNFDRRASSRKMRWTRDSPGKRSLASARTCAQMKQPYRGQTRRRRRTCQKGCAFNRRTKITTEPHTGHVRDRRKPVRLKRRTLRSQKKLRAQRRHGPVLCSDVVTGPVKATLSHTECYPGTELGHAYSWSARRPRLGG